MKYLGKFYFVNLISRSLSKLNRIKEKKEFYFLIFPPLSEAFVDSDLVVPFWR
jgi:hypothetical protein